MSEFAKAKNAKERAKKKERARNAENVNRKANS